ncbi:MAG: hypothetical protein ACI4QB_08590, partial [Eubacteriales bacterium]
TGGNERRRGKKPQVFCAFQCPEPKKTGFHGLFGLTGHIHAYYTTRNGRKQPENAVNRETADAHKGGKDRLDKRRALCENGSSLYKERSKTDGYAI